MEFDTVIPNALKFENGLYNKKYSESFFRVIKKSRLELTYRYDKTCQFMIRCNKSSGIVKFLVKRQNHNCSIKDSIKSNSAAKFNLKVYCYIDVNIFSINIDHIIFNRNNVAPEKLNRSLIVKQIQPIARLSLYLPAVNQQELTFAHQQQLTTTSFGQRRHLMIMLRSHRLTFLLQK
jgi:hypothetical protein